MDAVARILDANLNRAREALRVMEDAARFALNDAVLCEELKVIRHELREVIDSAVKPGWLEANRDTRNDVGAAISTESEMNRSGGVLDTAIAAGKRLGEALRVIEEMLKTMSAPPQARRIEALRYRAYAIDAALQARFGSGRARQWRLCLILTQSLCKRAWGDVLRATLGAGADCVQVREKDMESGELLQHVQTVIEIARPHGASVIVNDRADIALAANADGVHVGQHDLSVADVRKIAGRSLLVGVSTHDLNEAKAAVGAGADYCGVGAMFETVLKPDRRPSGPGYMREFAAAFPGKPHLAIGGVTPDNVAKVIQAGAKGIAVSTVVCAASDPAATVAELLAHIPADGDANEFSPIIRQPVSFRK